MAAGIGAIGVIGTGLTALVALGQHVARHPISHAFVEHVVDSLPTKGAPQSRNKLLRDSSFLITFPLRRVTLIHEQTLKSQMLGCAYQASLISGQIGQRMNRITSGLKLSH